MELNIPTRQKNILEKKGISTTYDLVNLLPKAYKAYTTEFRDVDYYLSQRTGCFIGEITGLKKKVSNGRSVINFKLKMNDKLVNVCIIGQNYLYNILTKMLTEPEIAVFGTLEYKEPFGFSIMQPDHISYMGAHKALLKIEPVYKKFTGISEDKLLELIDMSLSEEKNTEEIISSEELDANGFGALPGTFEAYYNLHHPASCDLTSAKKRLKINKLLSFSEKMLSIANKASVGTTVKLNSLNVTGDIVKNLPYTLSDDQKSCIEEMLALIKAGKRADYLIQGDVGSGKTIVGILLSFAMAENNRQSIFMAPTSILASQHYAEVKKYADRYNIKAVYLDGSVKVSEKKRIFEEIKNGEAKIIVGTQALTNEKIEFNHPGLVIIDEEHRFGVEQRNALLKLAEDGVNTICMSATPMPRSIAGVLHGNNTKIFDIKTMPSGRIPIQTAVNANDTVITSFIEKQLTEGRQAYVICPLIEEGENTPENVRSLTEMYSLYKERFEPFYKVDCLNGQMDSSEMDEVIRKFKDGETSILVSTTVVEVGVNVPNASTIVISNAERFGLATLHQLRGRVGRGKYKSYCILESEDKDNARLKTMCDFTSGFDIAKEDLKLRGAGDLIGIKQSGETEIMDLIQEDLSLYEQVKQMAEKRISDKLSIF